VPVLVMAVAIVFGAAAVATAVSVPAAGLPTTITVPQPTGMAAAPSRPGGGAPGARSAAVPPEVTLMPVGDSICRLTVGLVAARLRAAHLPVATVGTARVREPVDHQCRTSWSAASMAGLEPPPAWTDQQAIDTVEATRRLRPQVSYVMAGVNDLPHGYSPQQAAGNLRTLLSRLTSANPGGRYLVSTVLGFTSGVRAYNRLVPGVIAQLRAAGADIAFVDLAARFQPSDLSDGIHPNGVGQPKLATAWATALIPILSRPTVPTGVAGR
jgi:lysophospholipase L1-like esterase